MTFTDTHDSSLNNDTPQLSPLPAPQRTTHLSTNQVRLEEAETQLQNSLVSA